MEYCSILDLRQDRRKEEARPAFFQDLNLDQIIERICEDWEEVKDDYYYLPENQETEEYRRGIFADVKIPEVRSALEAFRDGMKARKKAAAQKEEVEENLQKQIWHIREVGYYCKGLQDLLEGLQKSCVASKGLKQMQEYLKEYLSTLDYMQMLQDLADLQQEYAGFRVLLTYEKDRFEVSEGAGQGEYDVFLRETFPDHGKSLKSPFQAAAELSDLEMEIIKAFKKKHGEFFKKAAAFYKTYDKYMREQVMTFFREIGYYLAFLEFEEKMTEMGCDFCKPRTENNRGMEATGLYDLALACVNLAQEKEVVSNDMNYWDGESFFVVTGPNQGGKTTFARSLGQLVYFTKMGLDVPAKDANVPYFGSILTHFSVEESAETGRGKLMDELERLVPMMDDPRDNGFVVINELFTTAANYDACIMGKKVLEHFIEQGCKGIYVTHLNELAKAHPAVVSLRATLDEQKKQTFKVERSEARELAGAGTQVKKYRLTYEQIKERFA